MMQYEKEPKSKSISGAIDISLCAIVGVWLMVFCGPKLSDYFISLLLTLTFFFGGALVELKECKEYFKSKETQQKAKK